MANKFCYITAPSKQAVQKSREQIQQRSTLTSASHTEPQVQPNFSLLHHWYMNKRHSLEETIVKLAQSDRLEKRLAEAR